MDTVANETLQELLELAHCCAARGWVPATSGNFSLRDEVGKILISRSGFDKRTMGIEDLIQLEKDGSVSSTSAGKPSAESMLHVVIYRERRETRAIAHVHTIWNTLLSGQFVANRHVALEGYELLKALSGVTTHRHRELVPIIENMQDYDALCLELAQVLKKYPEAHGVLLSSHGLYTWGQSVAEARRHLEALEFLFEAEMRRLQGSPK
jgi:methylthioribulose-1-phosphate dehydratase